jgi:hypothetical protein
MSQITVVAGLEGVDTSTAPKMPFAFPSSSSDVFMTPFFVSVSVHNGFLAVPVMTIILYRYLSGFVWSHDKMLIRTRKSVF